MMRGRMRREGMKKMRKGKKRKGKKRKGKKRKGKKRKGKMKKGKKGKRMRERKRGKKRKKNVPPSMEPTTYKGIVPSKWPGGQKWFCSAAQEARTRKTRLALFAAWEKERKGKRKREGSRRIYRPPSPV